MLLPPAALAHLRPAFLKYASPRGEDSALMVGGTLDARGRLSKRDTACFLRAQRDMAAAGIFLRPDAAISIANLNPLHGGEDFFATPLAAKTILVCHVHHPPEDWMQQLAGEGSYLAASPHYNVPGIWPRRCAEAGAKAVWVYGGSGNDVGRRHFTGNDSVYALGMTGAFGGEQTALFLRSGLPAAAPQQAGGIFKSLKKRIFPGL